MRKLATALSLSVCIVALAASAALAQAYPPRPGPAVTVDVTVVTPNKTIKVDGTDWGPGTRVEITEREGAESAGATSLGFTEVAEDGTFEADVVVPEGSTGDLEFVGVDDSGATQTRQLTLKVADGAAVASAASGAAAEAVDATPAVSMLTPGNGALVALVLLGALALLVGPIRRRSARG
jgi:hypothetical protein